MAKLPNITEDRQTIQAGVNTGVSPTNIPIAAETEAVGNLGNTLQKAGASIINTDDHLQRFNYALNKSRLARENAQLVNKIEQDINNTGDYAAARENYDKGIFDIRNSLGKDLTHPAYRNKFNEDIASVKENTLLKVQDLQEKAQAASQYALAEKELDATVESVMQTKDPLVQQDLIKSGLAPVIAAIPNTDPAKDIKVAALEKEYKKRIGIGVFNSLTPKEQIHALDNHDKDPKAFSTAAFIPAEDRPVYRKRAEQALKQQADNTVADIRNREYLATFNAKQNALKIVQDGGSLSQLPIQQAARLSAEDWNNLNRAQQIQNGTFQLDPIEGNRAYDNYSAQFSTDPKAFAKVDPITIRATVPPNKVDEVLGWHQKAMSGGEAPVTLKQYNDVAGETLQQVGIKPTSDKGVLFKTKLNQQVEAFKEEKKRDPSAKELQDMASGLVVKASFDRFILPDKEKFIFQGDSEDIVVPEDFANKIVSQAQKNNLGPLTKEQVKAAYLRKLNAR